MVTINSEPIELALGTSIGVTSRCRAPYPTFPSISLTTPQSTTAPAPHVSQQRRAERPRKHAREIENAQSPERRTVRHEVVY